MHGADRIDVGCVSTAVAGMMIGTRLRARLAPATFHRWLLAGLGLIGLKLPVIG